jgi:hypothetical protein
VGADTPVINLLPLLLSKSAGGRSLNQLPTPRRKWHHDWEGWRLKRTGHWRWAAETNLGGTQPITRVLQENLQAPHVCRCGRTYCLVPGELFVGDGETLLCRSRTAYAAAGSVMCQYRSRLSIIIDNAIRPRPVPLT